MKRGYILAPEAVLDLDEIWMYIRRKASSAMANRVEAVIRERIGSLAKNPRSGHWRRDLTGENDKFFTLYSYLVVYRPETKPIQVVAIVHGRRKLEQLLKDRL
jgi:plasmid stabilization system protein ParE